MAEPGFTAGDAWMRTQRKGIARLSNFEMGVWKKEIFLYEEDIFNRHHSGYRTRNTTRVW